MNKDYEAFHRYDFLTKELLEEEYIKNNLTDKQIAVKYLMPSKVVVWRKRKKFGIENKFPGKSNNNATVNRKYSIIYEDAKKYLDDGLTHKQIADIIHCSPQVVIRRLKELGLTTEKNHIEKYKFYNIELTESEKQVIIGTLMGDSSITQSNALSCIHSVKQSDYFFHILDKLNRISSGKFQQTNGLDPQGNVTHALHFTTGCNKYLEGLRPLYYPMNKKIFSKVVEDQLEAEGLAYWYMDDGNYHQVSGKVTLHTEGFDLAEIEKMKSFFYKKWGLWSAIHKRTRNKEDGTTYLQYVLRFINSGSFINIVHSFIHKSMLYKTGDIAAYFLWKDKMSKFDEYELSPAKIE